MQVILRQQMGNLGSMYHAGRGVRRDPAPAYLWMLLVM